MYRPVAPKTKSELIELIVVRTSVRTPQEQQQLRKDLSAYSTEELDRYLQLEFAEDRFHEALAESAAERLRYQLWLQEAKEPQRQAEEKAQLAKDHKTFTDAARSLQSFGVTEANFNVTRQILGPGFSTYDIQQGLSSNALQLSPATQAELSEWTREAKEAEIRRLKNMDLTRLRKVVRDEGARIVGQQPAPDETQRVRQATRADGIVYPPLPEEFVENGKEVVLDAAFIKKSSRETYRLLLDRYGSDQITEALRTRVPGNSW